MTSTSSATEVARFLRLLYRPGDVFEVRAPKNRPRRNSTFTATVSGYFTFETIDAAAQAIASLDDAGTAPGIYVTLNPVRPELLARSAHRLNFKAAETTADGDVVARHRLLIDADPVRPSGISATEAELGIAESCIRAVVGQLRAAGWPDPIVGMSGNGWHAEYAINIATDDHSLVRRVLDALASKHNTEAVKIDASVFNAARITKVLGTVARKGDNMVGVPGVEDRPHRRSRLVQAPSAMVEVPLQLLEALAGEAPASAPTVRVQAIRSPRQTAAASMKFDQFDHTAVGVKEYLERHGVTVKSVIPKADGTYLHLASCPVIPDCPSTGDSDISVIVLPNGAIAYKNLHDRGRDLGWIDAREALEPGYRAFAQSSSASVTDVPVAGKVRLRPLGVGNDDRVVVSVLDGSGCEIARDKVDRDSHRSRESLINRIGEVVPLEHTDRQEIDAALRGLADPVPPAASDHRSRDDLLAEMDRCRQETLAGMPAEIVAEAEALLADPNLIDHIDRHIAEVGVVGEEVLGMTYYAQGVSRLLQEPISTISQGTSSSGKSFVMMRVASLFPPETVFMATDITTNALYYTPPGGLMHRWVIAGERSRDESPEKAECKRALREMISSGFLRKAIPLKQADGSFQTVILEQFGPIAFGETTTSTEIFDEDANRCLLLSTDETPEQTARVIDAIALAAAKPRSTVSRTEMVHHALQRLLRRVNVVVPFALRIAQYVPVNRPEARRAMTQVISMVKAFAVLHQRQRKAGLIEDGDTIVATLDDYILARRILSSPLGRSLGGALTDAVRRFAERLRSRYGAEVFSSTQATEADEILNSKSKVNQYLSTLANAGVVDCVEPHKGSRPAQWKIIGEIPQAGADWLPTIGQLEEGTP